MNADQHINANGVILPGIRWRLLVALNATMAILTLLFLLYDYHHDRADRLASKQVALTEEARMLLLAMDRIKDGRRAAAQAYLDDVYAAMQEAHATKHVVAADFDGTILVAASDDDGVLDRREAFQSQSNSIAVGGEAFLAGRFGDGKRYALVAEDMAGIDVAVRRDLIRHLGSVATLAIAGAIAISLVLSRVVARPLERLALTVQQIGQGNLGAQSQPFTTRELAGLATTVNSMSNQLAANERERASQMAKARRIQEHLLPDVAGSNAFEVAASFRPADEIAGDYFDFIKRPDGSWIVSIADVSGHGVSAALNAAMLKVLLMDAAIRLTDPSAILSEIDRKLDAVTLPEMFATMLVMRICPADRALEYSSAGHESAWLLNPNGNLLELPSTGPVVGVDIGVPWRTARCDIEPGSRLLLLTDGVTETSTATGELYGRQKVCAAFAERGTDSVKERMDKIEKSLNFFRGESPVRDDATLVMIEFLSLKSSWS